MAVYTDKRTGKFFVKFVERGETYKKHLPKGITRRKAEQFEAAWKARILFAPYEQERKSVTFEDFLVKVFLPYSKANKKSFDLDVTVCRAALELFKGMQLRDIKPADIERFKTKRLNTPVSRLENGIRRNIRERKPSTVERELNVLAKVFSLAKDNDLCDFNPCHRVERLKFDNRQKRVLSEQDEEKFFAAFLSDWARDVCRLALYTGLRQSDVLGLQKFSLDWQQEEIRLVQGKTNRLVQIPMNSVVKEILQTWLKNNNSEYVFPSPKTGGKGTSVKKAVEGAIKRSGIARLTMRDLRRTAATRLLERGVDHLTIARILGHTSVRLVSLYAQTDNKIHAAMKTLEKSNVIEFKERKAG